MTYRVDITETPQRILELIQAAEQGDEVIITKNQQPVIRLISLAEDQPRPTFGSAHGQVHMRDDFDDPIDDFAPYLP